MTRTPEILMVDDNPADVALVRESMAETFHQSHVHCMQSGEDAIGFLCQVGQYRNAIRPDMVILDLNLPSKDGYMILKEIKVDPDLRQIPVVVFSSSDSKQDIAKSYQLGANCYVSKPANLKMFFAVVRAIEQFWFSYASLPEGEKNGR